jgi:hypothetical protein
MTPQKFNKFIDQFRGLSENGETISAGVKDLAETVSDG